MADLRHGEGPGGWGDTGSAVRDRGRGLQPAGISVPSNLVRIYNNGSNTINKFEACYVDTAGKNVFGDSISGLSAQVYGTIYEASFDEPVTFKVKNFADAVQYPTYGNMRDWFVATEPVAAGEYGWAYMSGVHYALVWDPYGLSTIGGLSTFKSKGWLYADLPDASYGSLYSATSNGRIHWCVDETGAGDGEVTQMGSYDISTPLMLRPNGRCRVLWVDTTTSFSSGDCQVQSNWPISEDEDGGVDGYVRLAIVERCGYSEAVLPCNIPSGSKVSEFLYAYDWVGLGGGSGLTSDVLGKTATNLAELDNCDDSSSLDECTGCYASADMCERVSGYPIPKLNECFGTCQWEMHPIGGWYYRELGNKITCSGSPTGQSVRITMGLDGSGNLYPYFDLQNPIFSKC